MAAAGGGAVTRDNSGEPVESVLKHFVANEQELDRQSSSSNIDPAHPEGRSPRYPFEIAVKNSDVGGVMCSYNHDQRHLRRAATRMP